MDVRMRLGVIALVVGLWAILLLGLLPIVPVVDRHEEGIPVIRYESILGRMGRADRIATKAGHLFN